VWILRGGATILGIRGVSPREIRGLEWTVLTQADFCGVTAEE
jgi:hypothetical protein